MRAYLDDRPAGLYADTPDGPAHARAPERLVTPALPILPLTLLAWHNRFIQDDAYISFVYSRNLINGHGLAWITGDLVEGYTNFLWVLLISAASWLGIDPVDASYGLGLFFFTVTLGLHLSAERARIRFTLLGWAVGAPAASAPTHSDDSTLARIWSAGLIQVKGLGSALCSAMYAVDRGLQVDEPGGSCRGGCRRQLRRRPRLDRVQPRARGG